MSAPVNLKQFEATGSHLEVGVAIGRRFAGQINRALETYGLFQEQILPYHRTPEGQARYQQLLELHQVRFPDYLEELEGLAQGAGRPFEDLFLVNMRGEYQGYLPKRYSRGCSDCVLVTDDVALIGHNEDGSPTFRDNMYIVHVRVEGKPDFTALSYPGFLCGSAFGFNAQGVCFSVDTVRPRNIRVGVSRHFIARSLLEARSLDDAIERVTTSGRASGFSYTVGSIPERRVVLVEVAPETHRVREIRDVYFHANHYLELDVDQVIHPSSRTRVKWAGAILQNNPPQNAAGILAILSDQTNEQYPIYRTATPPDNKMTFCTALFDLDARQLRIYTAHPTRSPKGFIEFAM